MPSPVRAEVEMLVIGGWWGDRSRPGVSALPEFEADGDQGGPSSARLGRTNASAPT